MRISSLFLAPILLLGLGCSADPGGTGLGDDNQPFTAGPCDAADIVGTWVVEYEDADPAVACGPRATHDLVVTVDAQGVVETDFLHNSETTFDGETCTLRAKRTSDSSVDFEEDRETQVLTLQFSGDEAVGDWFVERTWECGEFSSPEGGVSYEASASR